MVVLQKLKAKKEKSYDYLSKPVKKPHSTPTLS
jgi:hypothetical protein